MQSLTFMFSQVLQKH